MKLVKYSLILLLTLSACKSKKVIAETSSLKNIPARKIIKNHLSNIFNAETLDSKIKVQYSDTRKGKRKRHSFTVRLRMKRDSVIWFKGSKVILLKSLVPIHRPCIQALHEELQHLPFPFHTLLGQNNFSLKRKFHVLFSDLPFLLNMQNHILHQLSLIHI